MHYPSQLIENAVNEFTRLPGIGKKTALRLVLHLLNDEVETVKSFSDTMVRLREETRRCNKCNSLTDRPVCSICSNPARNNKMVCVVETFKDVIAIENTQHYNGVYHVLGGVISPINGVGPEQLYIDSLVERVMHEEVEEVMMALNPTLEGDTTVYYLSKKMSSYPVKITTLARGVSFGGELEYVDELTLARSIATRMPYESYLVNR